MSSLQQPLALQKRCHADSNPHQSAQSYTQRKASPQPFSTQQTWRVWRVLTVCSGRIQTFVAAVIFQWFVHRIRKLQSLSVKKNKTKPIEQISLSWILVCRPTAAWCWSIPDVSWDCRPAGRYNLVYPQKNCIELLLLLARAQ